MILLAMCLLVKVLFCWRINRMRIYTYIVADNVRVTYVYCRLGCTKEQQQYVRRKKITSLFRVIMMMLLICADAATPPMVLSIWCVQNKLLYSLFGGNMHFFLW